jgi:hypothetical protein
MSFIPSAISGGGYGASSNNGSDNDRNDNNNNNSNNGGYSHINLNNNLFEVSDSLDHALLESLFYNEMMFLEDASTSSSLFSTLTNPPSEPPSVITTAAAAAAAQDPNTLVEKDLLRDFGVTALSPPAPPPTQPPLSVTLPRTPVAPTVASSWNPVAIAPAPPVASTAPMIAPFPGSTLSTYPLVNNPLAPTPMIQPIMPLTPATSAPLSHITIEPATAASTTVAAAAPPPSQAPPVAALDEEQKRNKLVNQFAMLASRLGISLPPHLLQSLSSAAVTGEPVSFPNGATVASIAATESPILPFSLEKSPSTASLKSIETSPVDSAVASPLNAAHRHGSSAALMEDMGTAPGRKNSSSSLALSATNDPKPPLPYSKRRKKPRLDDCERELASLEAENAMLKRHLATISKQSHNFDLERTAAEQKMRAMLEVDAESEALDAIVKEYTELYSDYGKRRHQELVFHLEQLQR